MILDLAGKFDFALTNSENAPTAKTPSNVALEEAMAALQALGYSAREVAKVEKVLATQDLSTEAYVKAGLKALMN
jgi:Holliday junction DNA helicase RuvA